MAGKREAARSARISKTTIDAALPASERYTLWDTELKGFGLRVSPTGSKAFIARYRVGGGRKGQLRQQVIGRLDKLTPEQARVAAKRVLRDAEEGADPQAAKVARREEITVSDLCTLYLAEGCATKKPSTLYVDRGRIERHIKPRLGGRRLSSIERADIERFLQDVATGVTATTLKTKRRGKAVVRGGKGTATRTVGLLGGIFSFAQARGLVASNPVRGVERFKDGKSLRFLNATELARVGKALAAGGLNENGTDVIRLLILTGARKSEIERLRWSEIDFDHGVLRLGDSKTGAKAVPVGAAALKVLSTRSSQRASAYVFAAAGDPKRHYQGTPKVWSKVREAAKLPAVRLHDLRHTYASLAVGGGQSLPVIGAILGHRDTKTTQQYAHLGDNPVRRAADSISKAAAAAMAGSRRSSKRGRGAKA